MKVLSTLYGRAEDLEFVRSETAQGVCCSVVGISNLGKSALIRTLCDPSRQSPDSPTYVYVDCNQMPERTARAFFTAVWHTLLHTLERHGADEQVISRCRNLYAEMTEATTSTMNVILLFEEGFQLALGNLPGPLVLCLDEFDEAYQHLEPQTFLNLRSLRDQHGEAMAYVTTTERELARITHSREQGEFYELIVPHVRFLHFMETDVTSQFCERFAEREQVTFSEQDIRFVLDNADGHPGLVQAVCCALGAVTGEPRRNPTQDRVIHRHVQANLAADENVRTECQKIWEDLEEDERDALLHLQRSDIDQQAVRRLRAKFIVRGSEEEPQVFSRLFRDWIQGQKFVQQPNVRGVYVDVDAGSVWVDGKAVEGLTDLEYRLIMFLYGRLDRVCDKYSIVESVWGQDYVDSVDDARIEKLISRARQKIEPDPIHPRYLLSLRGRGYKLVR